MSSQFYKQRYHYDKIKTRKRPKTFKTKEKAEEYAKKLNLKSYEIVNLRNEESQKAKYKIVNLEK